jgi:hypothetical protein
VSPVDEQLIAAHTGLAHRDRELAFPDAVQLDRSKFLLGYDTLMDRYE